MVIDSAYFYILHSDVPQNIQSDIIIMSGKCLWNRETFPSTLALEMADLGGSYLHW